MEWVPACKKFFIPVKALSSVFRGVLLKLLQQHALTGKIKLPGEIPDFKGVYQALSPACTPFRLLQGAVFGGFSNLQYQNQTGCL